MGLRTHNNFQLCMLTSTNTTLEFFNNNNSIMFLNSVNFQCSIKFTVGLYFLGKKKPSRDLCLFKIPT